MRRLVAGCAALLLAASTASPSLAQAGLSVAAKKCGQKTCAAETYCSQFENMCRPCSEVCLTSSHNYQEKTCTQECQDYIHDQRYVRKEESGFSGIKGDVDKLYILVIICFILIGTLFSCIIGAFLFWYLRCRTNKKLFNPFKKTEAAQNNNKSTDDGPKIGYKSEALKLEMPAATVPSAPGSVSPSHGGPVTPATTSTPLSRNRHPSEDTTLDYAYDNPAMAPSPVLDQQAGNHNYQKRESSF